MEAIRNFNLRARFIEILEATDFGSFRRDAERDTDEMNIDFSKEPEYWEWLARLNSKRTEDKDEEIKSSWLDKAIQIYEEAKKVEPSDTMFTLYMRFLRNVIGHRRSGETQSSGLFSNSDSTVDPISHALMVYERAESLDCITEDLACQHISLFIELGRLE